jgi:hypothetical protein
MSLAEQVAAAFGAAQEAEAARRENPNDTTKPGVDGAAALGALLGAADVDGEAAAD